jgi:hypothetical protein
MMPGILRNYAPLLCSSQSQVSLMTGTYFCGVRDPFLQHSSFLSFLMTFLHYFRKPPPLLECVTSSVHMSSCKNLALHQRAGQHCRLSQPCSGSPGGHLFLSGQCQFTLMVVSARFA